MVRLWTPIKAATVLLLSAQQAVAALPAVDLSDIDSMKAAARLVAEDLLSFYPIDRIPNWVPGILPGPPPDGDYYWWQGGAMWGTLLDYVHVTGDTDFNPLITQAMMHQRGQDLNYNPRNWSASMGNDDQAFWAMSAMIAAETAYDAPPEDEPGWVTLVQAVFNEQTHSQRRAPLDGGCKGGLRWQVYPTNTGWDYINTISNGCYFNLGARLAHYFDKNQTYVDLVENTYDILSEMGHISEDWNVYDGAYLPNCDKLVLPQFSYNAAVLMQGVAFLYNMTESEKWLTELNGLVNRSMTIFFPNGIAYEPSCENAPKGCTTDMLSFKGYIHRWMASSTVLAPHIREVVAPVLRSSTKAALAQCTGGDNGRMCGFHWNSGTFDGKVGAGQQMNVLGALISCIVMTQAEQAVPPVTQSTGGTSAGNFNAGTDADAVVIELAPITGGDRAGASIVTVLLVVIAVGAFTWMAFVDPEEKSRMNLLEKIAIATGLTGAVATTTAGPAKGVGNNTDDSLGEK